MGSDYTRRVLRPASPPLYHRDKSVVSGSVGAVTIYVESKAWEGTSDTSCPSFRRHGGRRAQDALSQVGDGRLPQQHARARRQRGDSARSSPSGFQHYRGPEDLFFVFFVLLLHAAVGSDLTSSHLSSFIYGCVFLFFPVVGWFSCIYIRILYIWI